MLAKVRTAALWGLDVVPVTVETDVGSGLPRTIIVGLPDSTVRESQERLVSAFRHTGIDLPDGRITVNLSPTDLRKSGSHYDLPIAAAIAVAAGRVPRLHLGSVLFMGELALDGALRPVGGVLPAARWAAAHGVSAMVVPVENAPEAAAGGVDAIGVASLGEVFVLLWEGRRPPVPPLAPAPDVRDEDGDLADIRGQIPARRALEVAAAGGHNLLMVGPPGAGKTLLARRMAGLLPDLPRDLAVDVTCIHSAAGRLRPGHGLLVRPPFRAPHHTISAAALVGGGPAPRPGEVSLAHHGVLFLDELPEFRRDALEALRQPVEEGRTVLSRARYQVVFPARFALVAAMNPCPCGHAGDSGRVCTCSPGRIDLYRRRISGPLLDRIDLRIEVPRVRAEDLARGTRGETTAAVSARVRAARERAAAERGRLNGHLGLEAIERWCRPDGAAHRLLDEAMEKLGLSARGYHRVLRVARTIADLAGAETIGAAHVAEAVQYRGVERGETA